MAALQYFLLFFAGISAVAVCITCIDKRSARLHRWRVPERTLFLVALCGGAAAMWLTMRAIRHKTLHKRFMLGLPAIFLVQLAVFLYIVIRFPFCCF